MSFIPRLSRGPQRLWHRRAEGVCPRSRLWRRILTWARRGRGNRWPAVHIGHGDHNVMPKPQPATGQILPPSVSASSFVIGPGTHCRPCRGTRYTAPNCAVPSTNGPLSERAKGTAGGRHAHGGSTAGLHEIGSTPDEIASRWNKRRRRPRRIAGQHALSSRHGRDNRLRHRGSQAKRCLRASGGSGAAIGLQDARCRLAARGRPAGPRATGVDRRLEHHDQGDRHRLPDSQDARCASSRHIRENVIRDGIFSHAVPPRPERPRFRRAVFRQIRPTHDRASWRLRRLDPPMLRAPFEPSVHKVCLRVTAGSPSGPHRPRELPGPAGAVRSARG